MPAQSLISSQLAARLGTRQIEAVARADQAADAVEAILRREYRKLAQLLASVDRAGSSPATALQVAPRVREIARNFLPALHGAAFAVLSTNGRWGHRTAADQITRSLPRSYLAAAALHRLSESREPIETGQWVELREDFNEERLAGVVALSIDAAGRLHARDRASRLREPVSDSLTAEEQRQLFDRVLFPAPSLQRIAEIMNRGGPGSLPWFQQLERSTRLAAPDQLASIVGGGFSAGKTAKEIERDLLPALNNVRVSARRVARTESMRIINALTQETNEQMGDLVVGYQIHAQLDENTRPKHAARNGRIWRKDSGVSMQQGLDMDGPTLPDDFNCRCFLAPILRPASEIVRPTPGSPASRISRDLGFDSPDQVFTTAQGKLVPDPSVYSEWWNQADERRQRIAVGSRRFDVLRKQLGDAMEWADFLDPLTWGLVPIERLKAESEIDRAVRVAKVKEEIAKRRELIRQAATVGFVVE